MKLKHLTLFTLLAAQAFAQSPSDRIDPKNLDKALLNRAINEEINNFRKANDLTPLFPNKEITKAAMDHAEYSIKQKELSHEQNIAQKRTVSDRIKVYANRNEVFSAENIAKIYIDIPINYPDVNGKTKLVHINTYKQAAEFLLKIWVDSPTHKKNLLSKDPQLTGIGLAYDSVSGVLIVVQVFAKF